MPSTFLNEIILIITAAFIGGFLARSLKLSPVLGYIVSGIAFGLVGKNFLDSYPVLLALSQIGVSLLLFTLGLEMSLDSLKYLNKRILFVGILQVVLTALVLYPLLLIFNMNSGVSLLLSVLFSFSSTAVVVKILEEKGQLNDFPGNNVFIILLVQDLLVVPVIYFLPILFTNTGFSPEVFFQFVFNLIKSLFLFIGIYLISKLLLSKILALLFKYPSHELTILATIFVTAISIGLLTSVGLPESIAAFFAGILISDQGKNLAPLSEIRPLRDISLVLFFVLTGILVNFSYIKSDLLMLLIFSILIVLIKSFSSYAVLRLFRYHNSPASFISSYLGSIGEFSLVIGQIAFTNRFLGDREYNILLSVFIIALILTPVSTKFFPILTKKIFYLKRNQGENPAPIEMYLNQLNNHVIICGHGRVGGEVRNLLDFATIPYAVIDFNKKIITELIDSKKFAIYGDPTDYEILKSAFINKAKALVIAVPDSLSQKKIIKGALEMNPNIFILCRSHIEDDKFDLINMGANSVVSPEFEAGVRLGRQVLEVFGIREEETSSFLKSLRKQHLFDTSRKP